MQLRIWLAATTASVAVTAGLSVTLTEPAHAERVNSPELAGTAVAWGNALVAASTVVAPDLAGIVTDSAVNQFSTAVVTTDGAFRIWGSPATTSETLAPAGVTDAASVVLDPLASGGLLLHRTGAVTGWGSGSADLATGAPASAEAIALNSDYAFAVTTEGRLVRWGKSTGTTVTTIPASLWERTDLVDVAVSNVGGVGLHRDGTLTGWGPADTPYVNLPDLGGAKVTQIVGGARSLGAVLDDGTLRVWDNSTKPLPSPSFPDHKVLSLSLGIDAAAILENRTTGVRSIAVWGKTASSTLPALNNEVQLAALEGKPLSAVALSDSHLVAIVTSFRTLTPASVSGSAFLGGTLTATPATFSLEPTTPATGQWFATRGDETSPIEGETGTTLDVTEDLIGATLTYRTTATRGEETLQSTSEPTAVVTGPVASTLTIRVSPPTGVFGSTRTVTVSARAGAEAATGTVALRAGALATTRALGGGSVSWPLPATLAAGSHQITATYAGNATTKPSSARATITVAKATSRISAKVRARGKTKKFAKKVTLSLAVGTTAPGTKAGTVRVILKGKSTKRVTATVNAHGVATVTVKKVKRGKYKITLTYAGNSNIAGSTTSQRARI